MKISVVLPVHNEEESIAFVIQDLEKTLKKHDYEIIVVNDYSKDNTLEILKKIKNIKVINNPYNLGYGASLKTGINAAKNEIIVMLDADATYPVESIPELLKYAGDYDLVSGARIGKFVKIPLLRKPAKFILVRIANYLTGIKIPDINCGLRVIKKSNIKKFFNILPSGFSFTTTHLLACLTNNYLVKFVPINYYEREGKSTMRSRDFFGFIKLIFKIMLFFDPLKFFLIPGIIFILAGIIHGTYQVMTLPTGLGQLSILLVLSGLQICFLGLLAEIIVGNRR